MSDREAEGFFWEGYHDCRRSKKAAISWGPYIWGYEAAERAGHGPNKFNYNSMINSHSLQCSLFDNSK